MTRYTLATGERRCEVWLKFEIPFLEHPEGASYCTGCILEFTDDLHRPTETMLSAYVTNPWCHTHGHTVSGWCLCVQCSVTSQQWWQQPEARTESRRRQAGQLSCVTSQVHSFRTGCSDTLLCSTHSWKLPGPIKTQSRCSSCISLLFYLTIFFQCFALDLEVCEIVFCLFCPSN